MGARQPVMWFVWRTEIGIEHGKSRKLRATATTTATEAETAATTTIRTHRAMSAALSGQSRKRRNGNG